MRGLTLVWVCLRNKTSAVFRGINYLGSWEDSILHTGAIPFTNIFYLEALKRADLIHAALGHEPVWKEQIKVSDSLLSSVHFEFVFRVPP